MNFLVNIVFTIITKISIVIKFLCTIFSIFRSIHLQIVIVILIVVVLVVVLVIVIVVWLVKTFRVSSNTFSWEVTDGLVLGRDAEAAFLSFSSSHSRIALVLNHLLFYNGTCISSSSIWSSTFNSSIGGWDSSDLKVVVLS